MEKIELRKMMLKKRTELDSKEAAQLSQLVQKRLMEQEIWQKAKSVALYCAIRKEVDTKLLLETAWGTGKKVYLPRCLEEKGQMCMVECPGDWALHKGAYAILEPDSEKCTNFCLWEEDTPDLIVVPGVAFDRKGHRLGFGSGYYDRLLEKSRQAGQNRMVLVGFAYSCQILDSLPKEDWDYPMQALCTDKEFLWLTI